MTMHTPMLLASATTMPADPDNWVMEAKFDGWRFLLHYTAEGEVKAYTRSGNAQYSGKLWGIQESLPTSRFSRDTILDVEVIVEGEGKQSTDVVTVMTNPRCGTLVAAVFDVLRMNGHDTMHLPWSDRRRLLEIALSRRGGSLQLSPAFEPNQDLLDAWLAMGMEDAVLKRRDSRYIPGSRNGSWLKLKPQKTIDCMITGFAPGAGKFEGMVGAVEFEIEPGMNGRASGMTDLVREDMTRHPENYIGRLAEFAYQTKTTGGLLRHPQFRRVRDDL